MCLDLSRPCIPTAALGEEAWKAQTNGSWGLMGIKWGELRNIPLSLGGNPQFSPYAPYPYPPYPYPYPFPYPYPQQGMPNNQVEHKPEEPKKEPVQQEENKQENKKTTQNGFS